MKKSSAILLLLIHLFNIAGYQCVFNYFIDQSDVKASKQFDQNLYDDKDLAEVKIPLNMPYINDMSEFERIDGNIEFNGIHYNYVKRKISGDTLYILCHPNNAKNKLIDEKTGYAGSLNDLPLNKKSPAPTIKKDGYSCEYRQPDQEYRISNTTDKTFLLSQLKSAKLPTVFYQVPGDPPEQIC